jgi:hypothetical protein
MTEDCKTILDFLNCDYELFENEPDGDKITARHVELCDEGRQKGFTPLLIVVSDLLVETLEMYCEDEEEEDPAILRKTILKDAESVDAEAFLSARLAEYQKAYGDDLLGEFLECESRDYLYSVEKENEVEEIILAKIPTVNPWELAAWIPMGGFNKCPSPAEQVAVFKHWYHKYGAVPDLVTYDVWELELHRKEAVNTDIEAEALAKEQFAFCEDIVTQASEEYSSIRGLASQLKGSTAWFFWWD